MTEKFTQHNQEDIATILGKDRLSSEKIVSKQDIEQVIEKDIQDVKEKIDDIAHISRAQEGQIKKLGGDVNKVKEKTKGIFNSLRTVQDKLEKNFSKIIGVLGVVAGATGTADYLAEKQLEKKDKEYRQERKANTEKWEMKESDEKLFNFLKRIKNDSTQSIEVINILHSLFNKEELLYNVPDVLQIDDTTREIGKFNFLFDHDLMERMVKIDQFFDISPEFLLQHFAHNHDLKLLIKSPQFDADIFPQILHVHELIPQTGEKHSSGFIDINNGFRDLNNPTYHKALSFIFTKNFHPSNSQFNLSESIINIYSNESLRQFVDHLSSKDIFFDETISWCSSDPDINVLSSPKKYENFLELFNEKFPISNAELQIITSSNKYTDDMKIYIKNSDFLKRLDKIKDQGLDFRPMLHVKSETIQNIIDNKKFLEAYVFLAKNFIINRDGYDNVDNILSWYTSGGDINTEKMESDFQWRKEKTGISNISYFYEKLMNENINDFKHVVLSSEVAQERHIDEFSKDPAFHFIIERLNVLKMTPEYLKKFPDKEQKEWILRVARNMYISDIKPTESNFEQIFKKTLEMRNNQEILEQSLFAGRNVALFAHNEKWSEKEKFDRFGTSSTISALKAQSPENLTVFKAIENTEQNLIDQKRRLLDFLSNHDKITLVVNAHGGADAIYFTNGVPNKEGVIDKQNDFDYVTVNDLVLTLEQRFDNGHTDVPILIFSSCYNQDFIRSLYDNIIHINDVKKKSIPIPIMCGSTEYGQFGFSDYDSKYKDRFLEAILDNKTNTKIKDLIEIEEHAKEKNIITNPSLFIPIKEDITNPNNKNSKKEVYFQIAEVQDKMKKQVSHMEGFAQSVQDGTINDQTVSYFEQVQPKTAKAIREALKKKQVNELEDNQA